MGALEKDEDEREKKYRRRQFKMILLTLLSMKTIFLTRVDL